MTAFFRRMSPFVAAALASLSTALGQDAPPANKAGDAAIAAAARLRDAVSRIDPGASFTDNGAEFAVAGVEVLLIYDTGADRMRLIAPVANADALTDEDMTRLMQANFDSALDARYAIAKGVLWSTFLHPLTSLGGDEFGSGLGQTVNLVNTYGTTYNSGLFVFGGGDSAEEQRELIEELEKKSSEI